MIWKDIPSLAGVQASEDGQIRVCGAVLKDHRRVRRYRGVFVMKLRMVHRLVCEAFHGAPPFKGAEAMHLDSNPENNRADNLKWGSHAENMAMDRGNGHSHPGEENSNAKLSLAAVADIRSAFANLRNGKWGRNTLAKKYGISAQHCWRVATAKQGGWKHVL